MSSTPKDRVNELINHLGLSKNQFAKTIGTSSAMISKVTTKNINFGIDLAEKIISTFPSINPAWLLTGVGEMMLTNSSEHTHLNTHHDTHQGKKYSQESVPTKGTKNSLGGIADDENEAVTADEASHRESGSKWYNRRITESRLYKRHPDAESGAMSDALATSTIGSDSDRIIRYLHDTAYSRIEEVLDQVATEALSMSEAAEQIKAITAPLEEIKQHFNAIESAIVHMTAAAIERFPGVVDVVGYHVREAIAEAAEREAEEDTNKG